MAEKRQRAGLGGGVDCAWQTTTRTLEAEAEHEHQLPALRAARLMLSVGWPPALFCAKLTNPAFAAAMLAKHLLLIDLETTGLNPQRDSVVQIASCLLAKDDLREVRWFETLVRPETPISEEARAVHGLSSDRLASAPPVREAVTRFARFAPPDAILCGHNVGFDVAFLKSAYQSASVEYPFDYHTVDIWSLAFFVLGAEGISGTRFNLDGLCALYGIPRGRKHDALEDVRASAVVLRHLFAGIRAKGSEGSGQLKLFAAP